MSEGMVCTDGTRADPGHRVFNLQRATATPASPMATPSTTGVMATAVHRELPATRAGALCQRRRDHRCRPDQPASGRHLDPVPRTGWRDVAGRHGTPVGPLVDVTGALIALVPEAPPGGAVSYSFTATSAGTYLYESGSDPQLQVQMGLFGALVIRPAGIAITPEDILAIPYEDGTAPGQTNADAGMTLAEADSRSGTRGVRLRRCRPGYPDKCDPSAIYDSAPEMENILMLSEIDPGVHTFMEQHVGDPGKPQLECLSECVRGPLLHDQRAFDARHRGAEQRSVVAIAAVWVDGPRPAMGSARQPARCDASIPRGRCCRLRLPSSLESRARDRRGRLADEGRLDGRTPPATTTQRASSTSWSAQARQSTPRSGGPMRRPTAIPMVIRLPAAWPQSLNLQEGDFWSGSPYLGDSGQLNPGILTKTQCGEYYHVAHNHDLTQVTNYGITFGGMLTLIKVEPPAAAQAATEPGLRLMEKHTMNDTTQHPTTTSNPAGRHFDGYQEEYEAVGRCGDRHRRSGWWRRGGACRDLGRQRSGTRCASSVSCDHPDLHGQLHYRPRSGRGLDRHQRHGEQRAAPAVLRVRCQWCGCALAGSPNSTIKVPQGTTLTINLSQSGISDPIDLSFPSIPASDVEPRRQRVHRRAARSAPRCSNRARTPMRRGKSRWAWSGY